MIGYKVVIEEDGELISTIKENLGKYAVKYKLHEKVYPKVGKLFIFDTLEHAKNFLFSLNIFKINREYKIFKCRYKKSKYQNKFIIYDLYGLYDNDFEDFWRKRIKYKPYDFTKPLKGTIFADWVELIEEVEI